MPYKSARAAWTYYWDKSTGVLVEANVAFADYTMEIKADKTNMWQALLFRLDTIVFYALIIIVIAIVAMVAFWVIRRREARAKDLVS